MDVPQPDHILILSRSDVAALLDFDDCIAAVERALVSEARGDAAPAGVLGMPSAGGGFHIKAAILGNAHRSYFAAKCNANFPGNPKERGLPTIQGVLVLADALDGRPLAIMDSIEITIRRTGAATALAVRHLAAPEARIATMCGCGTQGRIQLRAIARARAIERAYAFDQDKAVARRFADDMAAALGLEVLATDDLGRATRDSGIVVTCTPSRQWLIGREHVRPGTFIAAVGADNHDKQEIAPALLASSTVVVDSLEQCARIGDLHHAIAAGAMDGAGVRATLGQVAAGLRPGRTRADEIVIFDSTGTALEDAAAAALVYEAAIQTGRGTRIAI